jgi:hypothetical protein
VGLRDGRPDEPTSDGPDHTACDGPADRPARQAADGRTSAGTQERARADVALQLGRVGATGKEQGSERRHGNLGHLFSMHPNDDDHAAPTGQADPQDAVDNMIRAYRLRMADDGTRDVRTHARAGSAIVDAAQNL